MKKAITSAGLLALGAVSLPTAHADWVAGADKPWSLSGTLRGFYDDNYNTQPDGPGRKGSFGFEVRPQIAINLNLDSTQIKSSYTYDYRYFGERDNNKADQSHDFEFFLNHSFNERYSANVTESFVIAQEPEVLDPGLSAPLRANGDNIRNNVAVNFSAQVTRLLGFVFGYSNTFYDYTGNQAGQLAGQPGYGTLLNRFEHLATLDSRWTIIDNQTVGIFGYQFGAVDYLSHGPINLGPYSALNPKLSPQTRNNYSHYIYVGLEHNFRSDLTFSGKGGIQISDYYNASSSDTGSTVTPYADLSLNYAYMDGGSLAVGFHHSKNQTDVSYDTTTAGLTQDQESSSVYATISQKLTPISPDLTASLTGQYQNSVYDGTSGVNGESDNIYLVGLNLSYQFNRYLSGEVGYNYDLLQSVIPGREYNRNRVYIGVTASY